MPNLENMLDAIEDKGLLCDCCTCQNECDAWFIPCEYSDDCFDEALVKNAYEDLIQFMPELSLKEAYDICPPLLSDEDKRKKFYGLFLNYSKLLNICQFSDHFIESFEYEEIKKYKELFKTCVEIRNRLRITHHEAVDFKEYESKMQKL